MSKVFNNIFYLLRDKKQGKLDDFESIHITACRRSESDPIQITLLKGDDYFDDAVNAFRDFLTNVENTMKQETEARELEEYYRLKSKYG